MPYILIGLSFILGFGLGWIAEGGRWELLFTSYVPALATLLAAFYGARFAFEFQNKKDKEGIRKHQITEGNKAIFALTRMANTLMVFQKQIISPVREDPMRFVTMQATLEIEHEVKLDFDSLSFLLDTDDRNLLGELMVEQDRYGRSLDAINHRSRMHLLNAQPLLERAGVTQDGMYSIEQFQEALGVRLFKSLQQATEQTISSVDDSIQSIECVSGKLTDCLKKLYPEATIIRFVKPDITVVGS
jgi:hypothetical protein